MRDGYDMSLEEFNEYLVSVFRALLTSKKFKKWLNDNYIIRHTLDPDDNKKLIKVEIVEKTSTKLYN
jgi:tripartite-type tricarboxylate transporter receptor subunit TctC